MLASLGARAKSASGRGAPARRAIQPFFAILCLAATLAAAVPSNGRAETLVSDLSARNISITSNFTGTEIVVFGTIERDASAVARPGQYDVVVELVGPRESFVTRRKDRTLGIWINRASQIFDNVPSFYAVNATRPLDEISAPPARKSNTLGFAYVIPDSAFQAPKTDEDPEKFRQAFIRLKQKSGLYTERSGTVEFLSPSLFRTTISLPANVPVGAYEAHAYLFRDQALLARVTNKLDIAKSGFEQLTFTMAHEYGLLYGLAAVLLALITGWLGGVIFKKD